MKDCDHLALWTYILLHATHDNIDVIFAGKRRTLKAGEFTTGRNKVAKDLSMSSSKVQRILKTFESEQQIEQVTDMKCRLIKVINWESFQESEQVIEQQVNKYRTSSEQVVNTKQECKNVKNEINIPFDNFWNAYDKKTDRSKTEKKWKSLSNKKRELAMNSVKDYVKNTPEKKFRKNAITWLNGECWEDEADVETKKSFNHWD